MFIVFSIHATSYPLCEFYLQWLRYFFFQILFVGKIVSLNFILFGLWRLGVRNNNILNYRCSCDAYTTFCFVGNGALSQGSSNRSAKLTTHIHLVPKLRQNRTIQVAYRRGWGFDPPSPKFRRLSKIVPNSTRLWKLLKIAKFRTPTHRDIWGKKAVKF